MKKTLSLGLAALLALTPSTGRTEGKQSATNSLYSIWTNSISKLKKILPGDQEYCDPNEFDDKQVHNQGIFALFSLPNHSLDEQTEGLTDYVQGLMRFEYIQMQGLKHELENIGKKGRELKESGLLDILSQEGQISLDIDKMIKERTLSDNYLLGALLDSGRDLYSKLKYAYDPNFDKEVKELTDNLGNPFTHYLRGFYQRQKSRINNALIKKGLSREQIEMDPLYLLMERKETLINDLEEKMKGVKLDQGDLIANLAGGGRALTSYFEGIILGMFENSSLREGSQPISFGDIMDYACKDFQDNFSEVNLSRDTANTRLKYSVIGAKQVDSPKLNHEFTITNTLDDSTVEIHYQPNYPEYGQCTAHVWIDRGKPFSREFGLTNLVYDGSPGRFRAIQRNYFSEPLVQNR